jgi:hypothetical protein
MKCPLYSQENERRTLETIEFDDLEKLKDIEEGYAVEYKRDFEKEVRKKMPKEIASFANAAGGWIFVGIDDDGNYVGIKEGRADFDQILAQLVHRHIMPFPRFEARFICDPEGSDDKGVLVIEVQEGIEPPYVANGDVYVRLGSSSEHMEKADSFTLIDLNRKSRRYREEMEEFCHRDVYLPPSSVHDDREVFAFPVFDIYLKRIVSKPNSIVPFTKIDETVNLFEKLYTEGDFTEGFYCQHTYHSLIFRERLGIITDNIGPIIELFYDGSMKATVPIMYAQAGEERDTILGTLQSIRPIQNEKLVRVLDGKRSLYLVMSPCDIIDGYLQTIRRSLTEYALSIEFENMQGMLVYFDNEKYREFVRRYGYLNIGTLDEKTKPHLLRDDDPIFKEEKPLQAFVQFCFLEGLGLPIATNNETRVDALMKIIGISVQNQEGIDHD